MQFDIAALWSELSLAMIAPDPPLITTTPFPMFAKMTGVLSLATHPLSIGYLPLILFLGRNNDTERVNTDPRAPKAMVKAWAVRRAQREPGNADA